MRHIHHIPLLVLVFAINVLTVVGIANACPFCSSASQSLSEEIASMDAVVIARILEIRNHDEDGEIPKAQFEVTKVIKGEKWVKVGETILATYYGDGNKERAYMLTGTNPTAIMWSSPLGLSKTAEEYIVKLPSLPKDASRLQFFQDYLEDKDEMLARDAYDEFAKTPYAGVIALKDKMHHDKIIEFINDPEVPTTRRRLYFTMLGVCGSEQDAPMLEKMMRSGDRKQKAGLDALLACYLLLVGEKGLDEVDKLFLDRTDAEYQDTYSAIMAIRFHGNEVDKIKRERLVKSLRLILKNPKLADLVIPDLARWEDWEVMPRLVELFKTADESSSWVRVPVINYLRSCPLAEAKAYIDELNEIDPAAVKRAMTFFPYTEKEDKPADTDASQAPINQTSQMEFLQPLPPPDASDLETIAVSEAATKSVDSDAARVQKAAATVVSHADSQPQKVAPVARSETDVSADSAPKAKDSKQLTAAFPSPAGDSSKTKFTMNLTTILGVPAIMGTVLFFSFRMLLGLPLVGRPRD